MKKMKLINTLKQVILEVGEEEPLPQQKKPGLFSKIKKVFKKKPQQPEPIPELEYLIPRMNREVLFTEEETIEGKPRISKYRGRVEIKSLSDLNIYNFLNTGMSTITKFKLTWNPGGFFEVKIDPPKVGSFDVINSSGNLYTFSYGDIFVELAPDEYGEDKRTVRIERVAINT